MAKSNINMCEGPILRPTLSFMLPILLTGIVQQLFNAADVVLAGRLGTTGSDAVAAVGSTTSITALLINFFIGCSAGSVVTLTHMLGAQNEKQSRETVHTAMLLAVIIGVFLSIVGIFSAEFLLSAMSTPESILGQASAYLRTYFTSMIPYMIYYFGVAILRANGDTKKPFYYLLISAPIKIVLTVVFVSLLKLDVVGLALAGTCSQAVSAALVLTDLFRRNDVIKLSLSELRISKRILAKILRFGIPSGIQSATFSLSSVIIQASINSLSHLDGFLAGNAAARSVEMFGEALTTAFYQVSLNFTGQNVGAQKYDRVKKIFLINNGISFAGCAVFALFFCLLSRPLLGFYIDDSPEAIAWGTVRIFFFFAPLFMQGIMDILSGALRGMGVSISNTLVSLICICGFRILWCMTVFKLDSFHNPYTLYFSYPAAWVLTVLVNGIVFTVVYRKRKKKYMST